MAIKYPLEWKKHKVRKNAYGQSMGEVNYQQSFPTGFKQISNIQYIFGYRQAIQDIKKLNPTEVKK
jgi:hypothetical protein